MQYDTTLSEEQLAQMLDSVRPEWRLCETTHVDTGHHAVARLTVDTARERKTCYLKATPPGKDPTVHLEARLLAGIGSQSSIPVPAVHGVVDTRDKLPAPYVLLSTSPGEAYSRTELQSVTDEELRSLARQSGRYLAMLHELDAVDAFGFLAHDGPSLVGEVPVDDFTTVAVSDPKRNWRETLRDWAGGTLQNLEETRFDDVVSDVRPVLDLHIEALEGPFRPVLARIDNSIENVLVAEGRITAFIDWEFTIAATPAYDLSCVAWSLAGGPYQFSPDAVDRRPLVRDALVSGYAEYHSGDVIEQYDRNRECYELLSTLRSMVHLRDWYQVFDLGDRIDETGRQLREELEWWL